MSVTVRISGLASHPANRFARQYISYLYIKKDFFIFYEVGAQVSDFEV